MWRERRRPRLLVTWTYHEPVCLAQQSAALISRSPPTISQQLGEELSDAAAIAIALSLTGKHHQPIAKQPIIVSRARRQQSPPAWAGTLGRSFRRPELLARVADGCKINTGVPRGTHRPVSPRTFCWRATTRRAQRRPSII